MKLFVIFVFMTFSGWLQAAPLVLTDQSFYLGESRTVVIGELESSSAEPIEWTVSRQMLDELDGGELIAVTPEVMASGELEIQVSVPYISPSFENFEVDIVGRQAGQVTPVARVRLNLSVRAELVIRMRPMPEEIDFSSLSEQVNSDFDWNVPLDPETGEYKTITVNNHPRGIWVRFIFENPENIQLIRSGGYLVHIYRGEGEYIKHQPFDRETHLMQSGCEFEPITEEEWRNPDLGLLAEGKPWSTCEFRGFVPAGMAYGFGYREHYFEGKEHEKFVEIKNVGDLNTDLIEYYYSLEAMGISPLGAMCSTWD